MPNQIVFTARVTTERDWDNGLRGWRCPALNIPGAKVEFVYVDGDRADPAWYEVLSDHAIIRWVRSVPPPEVVISIKLTEELSTKELTLKWKKLAIILPVISTIMIALIAGVFSYISTWTNPSNASNPIVNKPPSEATEQITGTPSQTCKNGTLLSVSAKPSNWRIDVLTPTEIQVKEGGTISFSASGAWNAGAGAIGPDGKVAACECYVREEVVSGFSGQLGALIGRIGKDGDPFLIGSRNTLKATKSGTLYLGCNDNLGPCDGANRGSCYEVGNIGSIKVCVEVR